MRYKIVVGVLVLALVISLGVNIYYYSAIVDRQATVNNMRGHIILALAWEMSIVGRYLKNTTTNIDMHYIGWILRAACAIASSAWVSAKSVNLYWYMDYAPSSIDIYLSPYSEGSPTIVKTINPTAIEMIRTLSKTIYNMSYMIFVSGLDSKLTSQKGVNPISLLKEEEVLEDIINYCIDIRNLSEQIGDISPKFN